MVVDAVKNRVQIVIRKIFDFILTPILGHPSTICQSYGAGRFSQITTPYDLLNLRGRQMFTF
jgi:hypothetical protein